MRRMQTRTGVSVEQLLGWKTFGSEISMLKKLVQLPCFFLHYLFVPVDGSLVKYIGFMIYLLLGCS